MLSLLDFASKQNHFVHETKKLYKIAYFPTQTIGSKTSYMQDRISRKFPDLGFDTDDGLYLTPEAYLGFFQLILDP